MMRARALVKSVLLALILTSVSFGPLQAQNSSSSNTSASGSISLSTQPCSVSVVSAALNFGVWTWQGENERYYAGTDEVRAQLDLEISGGGPEGCDVTIASGGFWLEGTEKIGAPAIGPEFLAVWMNPGTGWSWTYLDNSGSVTVRGLTPHNNSPRPVGIGLMGVPNTLSPGKYEARFTVTISDPDTAP